MMNESIKGEGMERGVDLSLLDTSAMSEKEQMQLAPFHQCYRPHERAYTWRELREMGCVPVPKVEPTMELIKRQASFLEQSFYMFLESAPRDKNGNICDAPEDE